MRVDGDADMSHKVHEHSAMRVLIADDDPDVLLTLSTLLRGDGHEVIEVHKSDAVVQLVRRYRPEAVLLDIGMPLVTGIEIARQLRDELRQACPVLIAVTAWSQASAVELGRLAGFNHYLVKPCAPERLLGLLGALAAQLNPDQRGA